jgi:gamma-glutamylcyclotransferase (GGCT)/AIG2-like uncharacterized protein YtfP
MLNERHLIFVYGTLKKDGGNGAHTRHLREATYRGACSIPGVMVHLGYYPGLIEDSVCRVTGEVYEVTAQAIQSMDGYEGVPHNYQRRQVDTPWGRAWAYYKNHVTLPLAKNISCVSRGLWTGGLGDKAPYSEVVDFYQNKRYLEPKYRNMEKQPIIDNVPEVGAIGTWDDKRKCFVFPDGSTHTPPGTSLTSGLDLLKPGDPAVWTWSKDHGCWFDQLGNRKDTHGNVTPFPKTTPETKKPTTTRGVELMV